MIAIQRDEAFALNIYVATCDDCGAIVAIALSAQTLQARMRLLMPARWRVGMPVFCLDQTACAERSWQRYGRYIQEMITAAPRFP